ncbi:hypothetical protein RHS01_07155 [Rhizoctonia solani]|uniref:Uncharacterized protein n=1 Tax=Rhizoctonia solani TaxID=456999 RepID=A0A8H7M339_9AGAM|nr:hypothetical protein RHS01_07155 [Rhizoctonia solani]
MASPSHEDHTDLESLFGDGEYQDEAESEPQATQKRSMIQFPRAAVLSQNVGTIAPSSVPSSTEHTHSSGRLSSHSISPAMSTVSKVYSHNNKRDASPGPGPQTKRRRVDMGGRASVDNRKSILVCRKLRVGGRNYQYLDTSKIEVGSWTLGSTNKFVSACASKLERKGQSSSAFQRAHDYFRNWSYSAHHPFAEAHILLNALPDDPSDVLTQTLRTILKTPTAIPRGRTSISRDTAVYLANGRLTGTPFLRLLRHLASPARSNNPALGLTLLKKLVEAMRATEDATSKSASSAASTPCPLLPILPPLPHSFRTTGQALIALPNKYLNQVSSLTSKLLPWSWLFRALPSGSDNTASTNEPMPMLEPLASDSSIDWGSLAGFPLEDLLAGWAPEEQLFPTDLIQSGQTLSTPISGIQEPEQSTRSISEQELKQQATSAGTARIPTRAEAAALLERARARKKELEQKLLAARRQLWGCKIEAGVERNVLEALKRER